MGNANNALRAIVGVAALATLTSMFWIDPLLNIINTYVQMSGF
jgi:hypothetical protein